MSYIGTEPKDIRSFGRTKFDYTATQGQTAFTGADDDGKVLAFTTGQIEVFVNGILMDESDFTTTGTGTVTLASAANLNDVISIVSFESNIPDNDYVPASGGTFTGNVTVGGTLGVTGATTMTGNLAINNASGSQVTLHRTDTTIANDDLLGQIIISGDDADTNASGTRGYIRGRSQGTGGGLKMEFGTAGGGVAIGDPRMTINADGIVTMPNQPSFHAKLSSAQTGFNATSLGNSYVTFDSEVVDQGNNHSSGVFTAPVAGTYFFKAEVYGSVNFTQSWLVINGARADGTDTVYITATNFVYYENIVHLSANDTVSFHPYHSSNSNVTINVNANHTWWKGHLLG